MEDKVLDYIVKFVNTTNICLSGVDCALSALAKQARINKRQKFLNVMFGMFILSMTSIIGDQNKQINNLTKKIEELESDKKGE